jgi:hypothetical protein
MERVGLFLRFPAGLPTQLPQLASGAWLTPMPHLAAELGIAAELACAERSADNLAMAPPSAC